MIKSNKKSDAVEMNLINKREILPLICRAGEISRAEISSISGLTTPAVSKIIEHLAKGDKLVRYIGIGKSSGGRRPVIFQFNAKEANFMYCKVK